MIDLSKERKPVLTEVEVLGFAAKNKTTGQWLSISNPDGPWSTILVMETKQELLSFAAQLKHYEKDVEIVEVLANIRAVPTN